MSKVTKIQVKSKQVLEKRLKILKVDKKSEGLHGALRKTLLTCRCVGLLPLAGLRDSSSYKLKFNLRTLYMIVYGVSFLGQMFMTVTSLNHLRSGFNMTNITNSLFYVSCFLAMLIILRFGHRWPQVVRKAELIERQLPPFDEDVAHHCNLTMLSLLCAAIVEHLLSSIYGFKVAYICDPNNTLETFFTHNMPYIFDYTSYTLWKGITIEILNIQATFMWSFNDLLIMVSSIYLAAHLVTHDAILKKVLAKETYHLDQLRTQFACIAKLVRIVNNNIGPSILASFACNMYWICVQLFNSLSNTNTGHFNACTLTKHDRSIYSFEHTFYFAYSFAYLVTKTLLVALLAARIRLVSVGLLAQLYQVPTENYTVEVQRYIDQVKYTKVALSGLDFFYVTRRMILTLVGTIVTYELVLLQFNIGSLAAKWTNITNLNKAIMPGK